MKNDSLAEIIRENFLKDYSFLLEENWFDGEAPPQLLSGKINMNPQDAAEFLYMLEATSYKEQQGKIKKYTPSEKKLYARYNLEKNRGRFKPFPILRSDSFKKTARITKPAVIKLLIFVLLSFIFNWYLWIKIISTFLFVWFLASYLLALEDARRAKKLEEQDSKNS